MLDPQASRFWQSALLSGLMDARELAACWDAIPPEKRSAAEHIDRRLARQAVHLKSLTLWQAQQLLAGRTAGYRVDRYVLLDLIGQGGMGRVYLAEDTRLNRQVALKILSPERVNNPRAIARFQREARVGAQLQHENLVRIYDFGESNGRYYLVMEYIEGKTIGTLISEGGPMPPAPAVRLVRQVAIGLEHAHRKGLIHRDVNPYNVLVTRDGTAKLADLGLAIDLAEEDRVTREGATVGTFDYVAPEQARHSHSADIRSDIYSLGCTLYHMCSGQVPFPTPSLPEKLFAHQAMEPEPLEKLAPGIPQALAAVIQRMMHKSPDERYATPLQVAIALEPFSDDHLGDESGEAQGLFSAKTEAETPPPRAPINQARAIATVQSGVSSAPAVVSALTPSYALKTPSGTEGDAGSRPGVNGAVSTRNRAHDGQSSDPDFPLCVDLGPEPSLGEALSRPRSRSASNDPIAPARGRGPLASLPRPWLWGLAVLTATVIILVAVLALKPPAGDFRKPPNQNAPNLKPDDSSPTNPEHPNETLAGEASTPDEKMPIVVCGEDGMTTPFPATELFKALETAMGHGRVELRNRKPIRLTSDQPLDLRSAQGKLRICAAAGTEPVIEVELKNGKPFLTTGSSVKLSVSGVTFKVQYPDPGAAPAAIQPAVITAAGAAEFERCAFKKLGPRVKASCAVFSEGGLLTVNQCWFEGFDRAIEVNASNPTRTYIRQSMMVPELAPDHVNPAEWYGWGVKFNFSGAVIALAKNPPAHVILDHCTVEGSGLIDLTGWKGPGHVEAELKQCVVRTSALLAIESKTQPAVQIHWRGDGDQYDILGHSWIVLSATAGTPALSCDITDLPSWAKFAEEIKPITNTLLYRVDPGKRSSDLRPRDFAVAPGESGKPQPGADPDKVGPWSPSTAVTAK
jgi:eukaryotic-like serine/threonine-protein kinase